MHALDGESVAETTQREEGIRDTDVKIASFPPSYFGFERGALSWSGSRSRTFAKELDESRHQS